MPFCSNCGKEMDANSRFCAGCGAPQGANESNQRRIVYEGEIRKCPNCGGIVNSFELRCGSCGHEIRGAKGSSVVSEFARKLEEIEKSRKEDKPVRGLIGAYASMFEASMGNANPVDKAKANFIMNFAIPNTKEDILEFMILANSNIDPTVIAGMANGSGYKEYQSQKTVMTAWKSKMDQAYQKAKMSFGNDPDFQNIEEIYRQKNGDITKKKTTQIAVIFGAFGFLILMFVLMGVMFSCSFDSKDKREEKLEAIVEEIEEDMENGDYDSALFKANNLYYDRSWSSSKADQWDERRQSIIEMIEKAKEESESNN